VANIVFEEVKGKDKSKRQTAKERRKRKEKAILKRGIDGKRKNN
jgi:hypothetical protein